MKGRAELTSAGHDDEPLAPPAPVDHVPGWPRAPRAARVVPCSSQAGLGTFRHRALLAPADPVATHEDR